MNVLTTLSKWYYGIEVDENNFHLDFEDTEVRDAEVDVGDFAPSNFVTAVAKAMTAVGSQDYTVSVNRETRLVTISADSNFDLLINSGDNSGLSIWNLIGFTGSSDLTGQNSYTGDTAIGKVFFNQWPLQGYIPFENDREASDGVVNQSGSGIIESVRFGNINFMTCNIRHQTERKQGANSTIETQANAIDNLRDFLKYATEKLEMEFMPDRDDEDNFTVCVLESTPESSDGIDFQIKPMYADRIKGYFETGVLRFRKVS